MPTLRIDDPTLLPLLLQDLRSRCDVVAEAADETTIQISILGSYGSASMRHAAYLRVRRWEAAQRERGVPVHVDID